MKKRSSRVYFISFILMVLGLLLQGLLLSGHIPFVHLSQFRTQAKPLPYQQYQTVVASRDEQMTPVLRMQRPTFQTGIIFPQWGTNAYDTTDKNWQIGLNDIGTQTSAQWIEIPVNLYQSSITSTQVGVSATTPTPDAVAAGIRTAHSKYYHVFIVPLLSAGPDVTYNWSGSIKFSNTQQMQEWFDSYWQALQPYVVASAQAGADEMSIGTEFEKLQQAPASLWNQLIDRVHQIFRGKLTYDMNWSSLYLYLDPTTHSSTLPSWMHNPSLDAIGVSVYIPLTDSQQRLDPGILPGLWHEKIGTLLDFLSTQLAKQVLISEIGYRDGDFALYEPWVRDLTKLQNETPDPQEQAAAYDAALSNVVADKHIEGIYFWAWSIDLFEPNWKPAAKILYKWYTSPLA
ncbi:MAG: glycoside hydrolase family 113 [Ktedonobacteraceae bacterium]